jgi:hypothetical protein
MGPALLQQNVSINIQRNKDCEKSYIREPELSLNTLLDKNFGSNVCSNQYSEQSYMRAAEL